MRSHVAFLRGVNVGGKAILPMQRLAEMASACGLGSAKTLLQSGNLVFDARERNIGAIGHELEESIEAEFGFRPAIVMRSREQLAQAMASNPFLASGADPARVITVFMPAAPSDEAIAKLDPSRFPDVVFTVVGREMHILYDDGMGSSKFVPAYYERRLGTLGTARNWNTIAKVLALLDE
jgi:uncharacterized protein (DUF1697 family)